jgi:hypothetical protein
VRARAVAPVMTRCHDRVVALVQRIRRDERSFCHGGVGEFN